jgi:hypothetical protein
VKRSKINLHLYQAYMKGFHATEETSGPPKKTHSSSSHENSSLFLLWIVFAFMYPATQTQPDWPRIRNTDLNTSNSTMLRPVLWIRDILVRNRRLCNWIRNLLFLSVTFNMHTKNYLFAYYFLKVPVHLHHSSKIKSHKEVTKL